MLIRSRMGVSADGEIIVLPILLGDGIPLWPPSSPSVPLRLTRAERTFPDGAAELAYAVR